MRYTLIQTWNATTAPQAFNLAAGDDIDTGTMSDCVSVVVLYGLIGTRYGSVVGQHGGGGIGNVNMAALLNLVPVPNRATMLVFIVTGHNAVGEGYTSTNNKAIRAAKQKLIEAGFRFIRIHYGWSRAIISDTGDCQKL